MISLTAEYALRAMVCMASHPDHSLTNIAIAEETHVPLSYLAKVTRTLRRAGFIDGRRGKYGGFALRCDPAAITVLDVINAVDPLKPVQICPKAQDLQQSQLCDLHRCLNEAMQRAEQVLASRSIQSLLDSNNPLKPLGLSPTSSPNHQT